MRTLLAYLPGLFCLAMVLLVCGPMLLRRARGQGCEPSAPPAATAEEVAELKEELARLRAELALRQGREPVDG
ncbi:MAG: hypothetical protein ACRDKW_16455 [Actinomycetota bacterium]